MSFGLIFDLDDTLIEEDDFQQSADAAVIQFLSSELGLSRERVRTALARADSSPRSERFQNLLSYLSAPGGDELLNRLIREHREHKPRIDWRSEVLPALHELKRFDVRMGIITDGYSVTQRNKLEVLNAAGLFESIVVTDELGPDREFWKPHPRAFEEVCAQLGVTTDRAAYVGDNPSKDFHVATRLPIVTIRLYRDSGVHIEKPYLQNVREHHGIRSLKELPAVIEGLGVLRK